MPPLKTTPRPAELWTKLAIVAALTACLFLIGLAGCSQNPYAAGQNSYAGGAYAQSNWPQQNGQVNPAEARIAELARRVQSYEADNRQLTTQLASSEQQSQAYQQELRLIREQLADTTKQFEAAKIAANDAIGQVKNFQASTRLRGNATIRPNTNLSQFANRLNLGSIPVRVDGEVIRISIPSDQLFASGTANMHAQAAGILDPVAAQLKSVFPRQKIAIEGHTDNVPPFGGQQATGHQLASAQATGVLSFLTTRNGMPAQQLFAVAQGPNVPLKSNETPAGRAANRRIELVIYPDSF